MSLKENHKARLDAVPDNLEILKRIKQQSHCREDFIHKCKESELEHFNNVYSEIWVLLNKIENLSCELESIQVISSRAFRNAAN